MSSAPRVCHFLQCHPNMHPTCTTKGNEVSKFLPFSLLLRVWGDLAAGSFLADDLLENWLEARHLLKEDQDLELCD